jgi:hypothetical protein
MSITLGPKLGLLINAFIGDPIYDQLRPLLRFIDAMSMGAVLNSTTSTPPASPNNGDSYLLLGEPTGAWSGMQNSVAVYSTQITVLGTNTTVPGWDFWTPQEGWTIWDAAQQLFWRYTGGQWTLSVNFGNPTTPGSTTCYDSFTANQNATVKQALLANYLLASGAMSTAVDMYAAGNVTASASLNGSGLGLGYRAVSQSYAPLATDYTINAVGGSMIQLPDATVVGNQQVMEPVETGGQVTHQTLSFGKVYVIKKSDNGALPVTLTGTNGQTIDGQASYALQSQYQYVVVQSTGTNWAVIGQTGVKQLMPFLANAVTSGTANVTVDYSKSLKQKLVLSASPQIAFANNVAGDTVSLVVQQDATGGWAPTWASNILGGVQPGTDPNGYCCFEWFFDGSYYVLVNSPIVNQ